MPPYPSSESITIKSQGTGLPHTQEYRKCKVWICNCGSQLSVMEQDYPIPPHTSTQIKQQQSTRYPCCISARQVARRCPFWIEQDQSTHVTFLHIRLLVFVSVWIGLNWSTHVAFFCTSGCSSLSFSESDDTTATATSSSDWSEGDSTDDDGISFDFSHSVAYSAQTSRKQQEQKERSRRRSKFSMHAFLLCTARQQTPAWNGKEMINFDFCMSFSYGNFCMTSYSLTGQENSILSFLMATTNFCMSFTYSKNSQHPERPLETRIWWPTHSTTNTTFTCISLFAHPKKMQTFFIRWPPIFACFSHGLENNRLKLLQVLACLLCMPCIIWKQSTITFWFPLRSIGNMTNFCM